MADTKLLKGIYIFKDFDEEELNSVAQIAEEKTILAGHEIFIRGQPADAFYMISMGSVKIYSSTDAGDEHSIAALSTGDHFGEIPFLDHGKRTATAQANEMSRLIEVKYDKLTRLLEGNPLMAMKLYRSYAHFVALRLRTTLGDLNAARETRLKHF